MLGCGKCGMRLQGLCGGQEGRGLLAPAGQRSNFASFTLQRILRSLQAPIEVPDALASLQEALRVSAASSCTSGRLWELPG